MHGVVTAYLKSPCGVLTDDPALVEPLVEQFDSVWRGEFCRDCGRRDFCGDPVV